MKKEFPYLPIGREIKFCKLENKFLQAAKLVAETESLDPSFPTGAVIVKNSKLIESGANGSNYHKNFGCERKKIGSKTGEDYELCEGCRPCNHAEQKAICNLFAKNKNPQDADLYLWGHWWCCQSCWQKMIEVEIKNVYLYEKAEEMWRK